MQIDKTFIFQSLFYFFKIFLSYPSLHSEMSSVYFHDNIDDFFFFFYENELIFFCKALVGEILKSPQVHWFWAL